MLDASEARIRAALVRSANRFVNEIAATPLIGAAERGEAIAELRFARLDLNPALGMIGSVYDSELAEALEAAGLQAIALGVRKLVVLGFSVVASVKQDADRRDRVFVDAMQLSFAMAQEPDPRTLEVPLLEGVMLPPAYQWRRRSEAARTTRSLEERVLALVAQQIERSAPRARLDLRQLAGTPLAPGVPQQMASMLRERGFSVDLDPGTAELSVRWDG